MVQASSMRALLRRLHPWIGKAVHSKWHVRRSFYADESEQILLALSTHRGLTLPNDLQVRVQKYLRLLHREWFPDNWRKQPAFTEVLHDFRWWLEVAERWNEPKPKPKRVYKRKTPVTEQPEALLTRLGLPSNCSEQRFLTAWRRFLKEHHPDRNPNQSAEDRRRFAEAVALRRRS
jgi:hypothetical protein